MTTVNKEVIKEKIISMEHGIIAAFCKAVGARDVYTMRHDQNVADLMLELAEFMKLSDNDSLFAYLSGVVHDVGKLGVPEHILNKPGRLSDAEYVIMKHHAVIGSEILQEIQGFDIIASAILHHHERFDGYGYPHGIGGEDIPFFSRMLAVCDSYDAMTSLRCYRQPFSREQALVEVENCSGTQFDPDVSTAFVEMMKERHKNIREIS